MECFVYVKYAFLQFFSTILQLDFPCGSAIKHPPLQEMQEMWVQSWFGKIPWRKTWQPTPVFLPGESHGKRSLVDYTPLHCRESDVTEVTEHDTSCNHQSDYVCCQYSSSILQFYLLPDISVLLALQEEFRVINCGCGHIFFIFRYIFLYFYARICIYIITDMFS